MFEVFDHQSMSSWSVASCRGSTLAKPKRRRMAKARPARAPTVSERWDRFI
jgi:hypothetical protein